MKRWNNIAGCLLVVAAGFFIFGTDVFAAEETGGGWRETYDLVLRWINFVILAVIIVKYARKPLKDFIFGQRKNLIRELERKEAEKKAITEKVDAVIAELKEGETRIEALKQRIIEQGKKKRQQIIGGAKEQSRLMLSDVQTRMENQIYQARYQLRSEMVDTAVDLALDRLPKILNETDNQKFIDSFISGATGK